MLKPLEERVNEAKELIIPLLKERSVDIGSEAFIDQQGAIRSRMVFIDTAVKSDVVVEPVADQSHPDAPSETPAPADLTTNPE